MSNDVIQITGVMDTGYFSNTGIYLCRPDNVRDTNVYKGTISTESLIGSQSFNPSFSALVRKNDQWTSLGNGNSNFWIDSTENDNNCSIAWYLKETAPAAVYAVRCRYEDENGYSRERTYQVLYTQSWTYINVTNDNGERQIYGFNGGNNLTLALNVTFNDGAASPSLANTTQTTGLTNVKVGAISDTSSIVNANSMDISVKTVSGKVYPIQKLQTESAGGNRWLVRFLENLDNDIYIVQFSSRANSRILGQFVIDNTAKNQGVNLSQLWVVLMIFGGLLALGASSAFLVPFFIVRINEARVYREKERVDRMKNPEKYLNQKKKSLKEVVGKIIYNLKTPVYKRQKEQEEQPKPVEEKVYSNRFTEMLRERQEKRDFMQEHNVTSEEMEKMKEAEEAAAADAANSFAFLRDDDDDEIATFHAAEDEVSTLETGSYVKDGTTFAKLDSLNDEELPKHDGNNDNGGF